MVVLPDLVWSSPNKRLLLVDWDTLQRVAVDALIAFCVFIVAFVFIIVVTLTKMNVFYKKSCVTVFPSIMNCMPEQTNLIMSLLFLTSKSWFTFFFIESSVILQNVFHEVKCQYIYLSTVNFTSSLCTLLVWSCRNFKDFLIFKTFFFFVVLMAKLLLHCDYFLITIAKCCLAFTLCHCKL